MNVPDWIIQRALPVVSPAALNVLLAVVQHGHRRVDADDDLGERWTLKASMRGLAKLAYRAPGTMPAALAELSERGFLTVHNATRPGAARAYTLYGERSENRTRSEDRTEKRSENRTPLASPAAHDHDHDLHTDPDLSLPPEDHDHDHVIGSEIELALAEAGVTSNAIPVWLKRWGAPRCWRALELTDRLANQFRPGRMYRLLQEGIPEPVPEPAAADPRAQWYLTQVHKRARSMVGVGWHQAVAIAERELPGLDALWEVAINQAPAF